MDEALVWYEGAGTADRRWLQADERGSVVAVSDAAGNALAINRYDDYGIPQAGNLGRFQYTGQAWLAELGMYYYKARMYAPTLGRFMQTDPIGYGDGLNWYNYVGADPVNGTDPSGLVDVRYCRSAFASYTDGSSEFIVNYICWTVNYPDPVRGIREPTIRKPREPRERPQKTRSIVDRLLDHYKKGKGKPYCLSDSDFLDIMNNAKPTGAASVPHRDGSGNRVLPVSLYGTPLENAYGNAALIINGQGGRVGFHDVYDFNASSHRGIIAELLTFGGSQIRGDPFSVDFNNRSCGGAD